LTKEKKDRIIQLITEFKSASYCCRKLISLNMELEAMNHQILGLSHNRPRLTREQERSELPMPSYQHSHTSPLALLEEITLVENEANYYKRRLQECRPIELLDLNDQNILFDLYIFRMNAYDVAEKYGYSKNGLYKHIYAELGKLI
jgi:hypothetical protein